MKEDEAGERKELNGKEKNREEKKKVKENRFKYIIIRRSNKYCIKDRNVKIKQETIIKEEK